MVAPSGVLPFCELRINVKLGKEVFCIVCMICCTGQCESLWIRFNKVLHSSRKSMTQYWPEYSYYRTNRTCHQDVYRRLLAMRKALSELQQKSENDTSQSKEFWEDEIQKAKEEVSQVCHEKLNAMEQKLHTTEGELSRALEENDRLKDQLELRSAALPVCKCNAVAHNSDFTHMNGISDEDPKITSFCVKPSIPTKNFWQEWDRLQSDLMKAESKADELNILLNQKLIELNKMQLTLSKQTKEMILLEKAYFQLRSHLSKRRLNRSSLSQLSLSLARSSSTTERASEDSSKSSDPEIPP